MVKDSVVMPSVRIPRKLWKSLEEIMRKRMFSGKAELIRDALREYALSERLRISSELRLSEGALTRHCGRSEDRIREDELLGWVRKLRL